MDDPDFPLTFIALDTLSQSVAISMGWDREARLLKIQRLWQEALGDPISRVSYPSALLDKELVVSCATALWKRELTFLLPEIRQKLREALPPFSGFDITFRVLRPFTPPRRSQNPSGPSPSQIEALWRQAEEIAARLPEPLRQRGHLFVFRRLLNGRRLMPPPPTGP